MFKFITNWKGKAEEGTLEVEIAPALVLPEEEAKSVFDQAVADQIAATKRKLLRTAIDNYIFGEDTLREIEGARKLVAKYRAEY